MYECIKPQTGTLIENNKEFEGFQPTHQIEWLAQSFKLNSMEDCLDKKDRDV